MHVCMCTQSNIQQYKNRVQEDKDNAVLWGSAGVVVAAGGAAMLCPAAAPVAKVAGGKTVAGMVCATGTVAAGINAWTYVRLFSFESDLQKCKTKVEGFRSLIEKTASKKDAFEPLYATDQAGAIIAQLAHEILRIPLPL